MFSNQTLNNGPVHYTKGTSPFPAIAHILLFSFLNLEFQDLEKTYTSISTNASCLFSQIMLWFYTYIYI